MTVEEDIRAAEQILPGTASLEGQEDVRWQAIIAVGEHIETNPEEVWQFIVRWGSHPDQDLRSAISTCLLEHLLEHDFDTFFPKVEDLALKDPLFADTFMLCWHFDEQSQHGKKMNDLAKTCIKRHA